VYGPSETTVEHVVGGHLDQVGADPRAPFREPPHRQRVDDQGPVGIGLAGVDRSPARGVHDQVRAEVVHGREHRVAIGHVEVPPVPPDEVAPGERPDELTAEQAAGSGDEHSGGHRPIIANQAG
jgi:hypothetical protein